MTALLLAGAYAASGKLALLLAIPPGFATAIWPPSGLALVGTLLWGPRAWPGVWLGSFLVNLGIAADSGNPAVFGKSALVAAAIGVGATAQAELGAFLVRRFVGFPTALLHGREILAFFLLGGPLSCLLNATWGVAVLYLAGLTPWGTVPFSWWTWWIGDSIGVLIVSPLMLIAFASPRPIWRSRLCPIGIPLCLALAVVMLLFIQVSAWSQGKITLEFERQAGSLAQTIQQNVDRHLDALHSIAGFFNTTPQVGRQQFQRLVAFALSQHQSIQALSWNQRITDAQRKDYEARARREGFPHFQVLELDAQGRLARAAPRDEYVAVTYIEPYNGNEQALGYDVSSHPVRREALDRARDTGKPVATSRITLVQETGAQAGMLVFIPIYRRDSPHDTIEERRRNLSGYAVGVYRIGDFIEQSLKPSRQEDIELFLLDESAPPGERVLFSNHATAQSAPQQSHADMEKDCPGGVRLTTTLTVADRRFTLRLARSAAYLIAHRTWESWTLLAGGLSLTGLMGVFLLALTGRTHLVEEVVANRTTELRQSLQERDVLLREIHHRVKNNLQIISSLLNLQTGQTADTGVRAAFQDSQNRITAMALIHETLYRSSDLTAIDMEPYIRKLVEQTVLLYGAGAITVTVKAGGVKLALDQAVPCGLILNELLSNAFKHAFPCRQGGAVLIALAPEAARLVLRVQDTGVGLPPGTDLSRPPTLGFRIVMALSDQLGGTFEALREQPGTTMRLSFPRGNS